MPTDQSDGTSAGGRGPSRRVFLIAAAAVLAAAVLVSVLLGGSHSSRRPSPAVTEARDAAERSSVRSAAVYLGVSPAEIRRELRSGQTLAQIAASTPGKSAEGIVQALLRRRTAALTAALASGRITSAQERAQLAALHARAAAEVNREHGAGAVAGAAHVAASYLGRPVKQLRKEVAEGRSLAEIANSTPGRSAAGLTAKIIAADRARIAAEAHAGKLTPAAERVLLASLPKRAALRVNAAPSPAATPAG